jgi:hypothetical protein
LLPNIVLANVGLVAEHCPAGELSAFGGIVDHDPVGLLVPACGGVRLKPVRRL